MKNTILTFTIFTLVATFLILPIVSSAHDPADEQGPLPHTHNSDGSVTWTGRAGSNPGAGGDASSNPGAGGDAGKTIENRTGVKLKNPLGDSSIKSILQNITNFLTKIGGLVVTIMIIIGAFQMIFATGDPEKFKKGRTTIVYAVIGLIIILIANGIMAVVNSILVTK